MGCCGGISKPKPPQVEQQPTVAQQENNVAPPPQNNVVNDNINSQRAAQVTREQYHKNRFWHG